MLDKFGFQALFDLHHIPIDFSRWKSGIFSIQSMQPTLERQPWRLLHKATLLDTFCYGDFPPSPAEGLRPHITFQTMDLKPLPKTSHFSNDRVHFLLSNFRSSALKPILNPATNVIVPTVWAHTAWSSSMLQAGPRLLFFLIRSHFCHSVFLHLCQQLCWRCLRLSLFDDISVSVSMGTYAKIFQRKCQEKTSYVQKAALTITSEGFPGQMIHSWNFYLSTLAASFLPQSQSLSWVFSAVSLIALPTYLTWATCVSHPPHQAVTVHLLPLDRNHSNTAIRVYCSPDCDKLL